MKKFLQFQNYAELTLPIINPSAAYIERSLVSASNEMVVSVGAVHGHGSRCPIIISSRLANISSLLEAGFTLGVPCVPVSLNLGRLAVAVPSAGAFNSNLAISDANCEVVVEKFPLHAFCRWTMKRVMRMGPKLRKIESSDIAKI